MSTERASTIANGNDIPVTKPRSVGRQRYRANAPAETAEDYFRINMFLPFLDHTIKHLNERFPAEIKPMLLGFYLVPKYNDQLTDETIKTIMKEYYDDLPYPEDFVQEAH